MSALQLLQLAEQRGLLEPQVVVSMRERLAAVQRSVTASEMAESLVKRGRLTQFQADSLLDAIRQIEDAEAEGVDLTADTMEESSLELLPLADEDDDNVTVLEAIPVAEPVELPEVELDGELKQKADSDPSDEELDDPLVDLSEHEALADESTTLLTRRSPLDSIKSLFVRQTGWQRTRRGPNFLLVGTGGLVLLSVLGAFLYFFLNRETSDQLFEEAERAYSEQSYDTAIQIYNDFIEAFPKHPKSSFAKVRCKLARLRQPVESADWDRALSVFQASIEIDKIDKEPAFDEVAPELAGILPEIYDGFAERADAADGIDDKEQNLTSAATVLEQIEEYVPGSQRPGIDLKLRNIQKTIAKVERDIARARAFNAALVDIATAVDSKDTVKAYAVHQALLDQYPGLRANTLLADKLKEIAAAERGAVFLSDTQRRATTDDHPLRVPNRVLLANRRGRGQTGVEGQVFSVAHGALYGLSAADGKVLWRRWMGFESTSFPLTLGSGAAMDVLALDELRQELIRLDGQTGKLIWRLELRELCSQPVLRKQVFVTTRSGKLMSIDPQTGTVVRTATLPQQLYSPSVIGTNDRVLYQAGDHSSVYVFDSESLECLGVYATGHKAGTVTVAPIVVGRHVLVPERILGAARKSGDDVTVLRSLLLNDDGLGIIERTTENLRLDGYVVSSSRLSDQAVIVTTDLGAAYIIASDPSNADQQLRIVARTATSGLAAAAHFGALVDDHVLVAGRGLERFEFQSANGALISRWAFSEESFHVAPPLRSGNSLFVQYKRPASQAIRVAAMDWSGTGNSEPEIKWSVDLGAAPAGPAFFDKTKRAIVTVSSDASAWQIGGSAMKARVLDQAVASIPGRTLFQVGGKLNSGATFYAARGGRTGFLTYKEQERSGSLQRNEVQVPEKKLACRLVVAGDQLVACTPPGVVYLIDPATGKPAAEPYRSASQIGSTVDWLPPTMTADGSVVVGTKDGQAKLLEIQAGRLAAKVTQSHETNFQSALVAWGDNVFVAGKSGPVTSMLCLRASDLAIIEATALDGKLTAGPFVVGDRIVCVTDDRRLHAFDATGKPAWTTDLADGPLAGPPVEHQSSWICASVNGRLWRLSPDSGQRLPWRAGLDQNGFEVGEPLGAAPFLMGTRLLLLGRDCTLFVVSLK